ncbi:neprilysin-2-like [Dermacentor variabilis]|uniref:neprilysin-2-like n=1 Tax=Dermacentor variabilis TaxID=34621 RepID=UPI003F5BA583
MSQRHMRHSRSQKGPGAGSTGLRKSTDEATKKVKHETPVNPVPQVTSVGQDKSSKLRHTSLPTNHGARRKSSTEGDPSRLKHFPSFDIGRRKSSTDIDFRRRKSIADMDFSVKKSLTENDTTRPVLRISLGQDGTSSRKVQHLLQPTDNEGPTRGREQLIVAAAVFVSVLLACIIAFLFFFTEGVKTVGYCVTDACLDHANRLLATINTSHDPCDNFYAFVCSGWQKGSPALSVQDKLNEDAVKDEIKELEADIWRVGRASRLYSKCVYPEESDTDVNVFWINNFMDTVNLDWPSRKPNLSNAQPLEVMLNMSAKYDLNFLFRLEIATNQSTGNVLVFCRRYNGVVWNDRLQRPLSLVDYARVAKQQLAELRREEYVEYEPSLLQRIEKSFTEANVYETHSEQSWFVISELDARTTNIEPGRWLKGLNSAYSSLKLSWAFDNFVVLEDAEILNRIDALFRDYTEVELLIGIAWMFIQSHLWVAAGKPGFMLYDNTEEKKQRACLEYVDSRFGPLSSSEHLTRLYPTHEARLGVSSFLQSLKAEFNQVMKRTPWVDREIRETATRKVNTMDLNILPAEQFFVPLQRAALYGQFPAINNTAFMESWLSSSAVYQALQMHQSFHDVFKKKRTFRHQAYTYAYLLNAVDGALAGLEPPLFYPTGTFAMNYASAGTLLAKEIIRSIDPAGTTVNDRGESIHWWGKSESAEYNRRLNCDLRIAAGQKAVSVIPAIPALELSYAAYKKAVKRETSMTGGVEDLRIRGLENFFDDQIFFMSHCYVLCGKKGDIGRQQECNVPLKHSFHFAEAFGCAVGSPMNVASKCSFFE